MGQKIPVANDGTNYYQARQFNDPYDRDTGNPCADITRGNYIAGNYTREYGKSSVIAGSEGGGGGGGGGLLVSGGQASGGSGSAFAFGSIVSRNTTWTAVLVSWTYEARSGEPMQWIGSDGTTLTLEQQQVLQEAYVRVPDHEFEPNFWGQCEKCPTHNMYRREINAHLYVIQETPDWLHELAS